MSKGRLFVISGPSGTGKGTICKEILDADKSIRLSVSMTTRNPRQGEEHGVHYYFATHDEFRQLIADEGFMEYAEVFGNFYGTPKKQVKEWLDQGISVILEIDVQGALQVKKNFPEGILIFILPPSMEELRNRIIGRGSETEESMARRLGAALEEINNIDQYDYRVVNDDLQEAVGQVQAVISAEQCRISNEEADEIISRYKEDL